MKKGILYGVGVGPGDSELLTLKALRVLQNADIIAVPDKGSGTKTALAIVKQFVEGKELLFCPTPMIRDRAKLEQGYTEIADRLCTLLDAGKTVAFITLGDPTIYSTYMYIHQKVAARGYDAVLVPGVPSFCAAAARLGVPLCEGAQRLLIVPAGSPLRDAMDITANKVYMKAGRGILELQDRLRQAGKLEGASLVANCTMEGEEVWPRFGDMTQPTGYYSLVISREEDCQ